MREKMASQKLFSVQILIDFWESKYIVSCFSILPSQWMMKIAFMKLSEDATTPTQAHPFDAAYDLHATEDYLLQPRERHLFATNIACLMPAGYYGRVAPRSGLAYKYGIDVLAGVVDRSYTGDIGVILINLGEEAYQVKKWDRIAQFIIENCAQVEWELVDSLEESARGEWARWSSGK